MDSMLTGAGTWEDVENVYYSEGRWFDSKPPLSLDQPVVFVLKSFVCLFFNYSDCKPQVN